MSESTSIARMIDLRSDTVTRPTAEMRSAMANAEVGDDVYREDPTVNQLERRAAEMLGKEAALFVPTGTMGNTIAIKLHTEPGQEVICEARGHLLNYELSMTGWFCGCLIRPVNSENGILTWSEVRKHYRPRGPHWAPTGCVELENTHNMAGGTVYPQVVLNEVCNESHALGLKVHLDGARLFNAAAATARSAAEIAARVDTVMFCLSKGLGAPAGSMLCGTQSDMERARLLRKRLGGGMRQAGILAAAGLISLERMTTRLGEDHANAQFLAKGLAAIEGISVDPKAVETNIVVFSVADAAMSATVISTELKKLGILINPIGPDIMRAVTHYDVTREDCETAVGAIRDILER
jgi:threonine aldolase